MSARPESMRNRIASGIVTLLENDINQFPDNWAAIPVTIKRFRGTAMQTLPRPAIFVASQGTQQVEQRMDGVGLARTKIMLTLCTADQSNPQGAICDLVTDVSRALSSNRGMLSIDNPGFQTIQGRIVIGDDDLEAIDDDPGEGICDLVIYVDFKWDGTNP